MIRETFLRLGARDGYVELEEQPMVRQDSETFFIMASVAANLDLFDPGRHTEPARYLTIQRVFSATRLDDAGKYPLAAPFEVMLSIFRFLDSGPDPAIEFVLEYLAETGIMPEQMIYLAPREMGIRDAVTRLGIGPDRILSWDRSIPLRLGPGRPEGHYLKVFAPYRTGLIPVATVGFVPLDGHVAVDSALFLERLDFMQNKLRHWYEGRYFLPVVNSVRNAPELVDLTETDQYMWANLLRSTAALLGDGVIPSGKGPGHVVRKMCRQLAGTIAGRELSKDTLVCLASATLACLHEVDHARDLTPETVVEVIGTFVNSASGQIARELARFSDRLGEGELSPVEAEMWHSERGLKPEWMVELGRQLGVRVPVAEQEDRFWLRNACYSYDDSRTITDPVAFIRDAEDRRMK